MIIGNLYTVLKEVKKKPKEYDIVALRRPTKYRVDHCQLSKLNLHSKN